MSTAAGGLRRVADRVVASDPGMARFAMAGTTVLTLAVSLGVLYAVTELTGQTITVVLLGVVVSMISSMAFQDPQPRQRFITAALMLAIAAASVTLGALLAPYIVAGDVVFVAIMTTATAARRRASPVDGVMTLSDISVTLARGGRLVNMPGCWAPRTSLDRAAMAMPTQID